MLLVRHERSVVSALHKASHGWRLRQPEMLLVVAEEGTLMHSFCQDFEDVAVPLIELERTEYAAAAAIAVFGPSASEYLLDDLPWQARARTEGRPRGTIAVLTMRENLRADAGYIEPSQLTAFAPAPLPIDARCPSKMAL